MTLTEAVNEIKSRHKPYIGIMHQGSYSNTLRDIERGAAKTATIERFVLKFGFEKLEYDCYQLIWHTVDCN